MCKAFSAVVDRKGEVYWKRSLDSHEEVKKHFKLIDDDASKLVAVEISPKNGNYFDTLQEGFGAIEHNWVFNFDNDKEVPPVDWWKASHEKACWDAQKQWLKEVLEVIDFEKLKIINPFKTFPNPKVGKAQKKELVAWASVRASVEESVEESVWASVEESVRASVGASVEESVWAQIGYGFRLTRSEWKYCEKIKGREYPFMPAVRLWQHGLVPVKYAGVWRVFGKKGGKVQELYCMKK